MLHNKLTAILVAWLVALLGRTTYAYTVVQNPGNGPDIYLDWDNTVDEPQSPSDFFVSFADENYPDIELRRGRLDWRLWSVDTDNPGGVGDIGVISSPAAENFRVNIRDPLDNPGARNVNAIELVPTSAANYSEVTGVISGDLYDALTVQTGSSGPGGFVDLEAQGNVHVNATIDFLNRLVARTISGTLVINRMVYLDAETVSGTMVINKQRGLMYVDNISGTIDIQTAEHIVGVDLVVSGPITGSLNISRIQGGSFVAYVFGGVSETGRIALGDLGTESGILLGYSTASDIAGTIFLNEGIKNSSLVTVYSRLTGVIDFNGSAIDSSASLDLRGGGPGSIINGGTISGVVSLGDLSIGSQFTGSASFQSVAAGSTITMNGDGTLDFAGVFDGELCGTNPTLVASQPLPNNIEIGCGLGHNATICGQAPACPFAFFDSNNPPYPPNGIRDARQPYPLGPINSPVALGARQGIGSPNPDARDADKILITLDDPGLRSISHDCWALCETGIEQVDIGTEELFPNKIACIHETVVGGDTYQFILDRPISAKHWTNIKYAAPAWQKVSWASLPGNANGDSLANSFNDPPTHNLCCVQRNCTPRYGEHSCNINHDTEPDGTPIWNATDTAVVEYLLDGEGNFIDWNGKTLPVNTCFSGTGGGNCPQDPCDGGPGPMSVLVFGGEDSLSLGDGESGTSDGVFVDTQNITANNAEFADWLVAFLTAADPDTAGEVESLQVIALSLAQWCVAHFTPEERAALAERLTDPPLAFASAAGSEAAATVVGELTP